VNDAQIDKIRTELLQAYPGCRVKVTDDKQEMVAELRFANGIAVAVIERSRPHFHGKMREVYRVLRGVLYVACGGRGHVLRKGESLTIDPGSIHYATAVGEPSWIEVESEPPWSPEDHHVL
jgi:mannose-6-phosphate isomerase-like protein (cupin superfamily)